MDVWLPSAPGQPSICCVQVKQDGITRLVVLPLYPQFSISTSASSLRLFEDAITKDPGLQGLSHIVIASWYWREGYLQAMADLIVQELEHFPDPSKAEVGCFSLSCGTVPRQLPCW